MALGVCWLLGVGDIDGFDGGWAASGKLAVWERAAGDGIMGGLRRSRRRWWWRWWWKQQSSPSTGTSCKPLAG
jgi:hypothetical protein